MALKITLLQTNPEWESTEHNIAQAEKLIGESDGELVVLPEMFSTGFTMNPASCAVAPRMAEDWFRSVATRNAKAVCGSVVVSQGGYFYNRMYFATPDGELVQYDKRHLFRMGGENEHYTAGNKRVVAHYKGVRILLSICYDLRFPVWLRNRRDYDLMINVASWAAPRQHIWETLLRARAIENQCYVIGVNRSGADTSANYRGGSMLVDFYGNPASEIVYDTTAKVETSIDMVSLEEFREKFPVLLDADEFEIRY